MDQRLWPFVNYYQDNWSELLPLINHVQLILPHSSIGIAPYELLYRRLLCTSFDWNTPKATLVQEKLSQDKARAIAERIRDALAKGKELMSKAQAKKENDINLYCQLIDFKEKDIV